MPKRRRVEDQVPRLTPEDTGVVPGGLATAQRLEVRPTSRVSFESIQWNDGRYERAVTVHAEARLPRRRVVFDHARGRAAQGPCRERSTTREGREDGRIDGALELLVEPSSAARHLTDGPKDGGILRIAGERLCPTPRTISLCLPYDGFAVLCREEWLTRDMGKVALTKGMRRSTVNSGRRGAAKTKRLPRWRCSSPLGRRVTIEVEERLFAAGALLSMESLILTSRLI
jgi:hypothetical protein